MRLWLTVAIVFGIVACSKKNKPAEEADPASFFKSQGTFCTVEKAGKAVATELDKLEEIFVFGRDNSLRVMTFDLDSRRRLQFNSKGQPKMKEIEKAGFRISGDKLLIKIEGTKREREAAFKRVTRGAQSCFELQPGKTSTTHCPCTLPAKE